MKKLLLLNILFLFGCSSLKQQVRELETENISLKQENKILELEVENSRDHVEYTCAAYIEMQSSGVLAYLGNYTFLNQITQNVIEYQEFVSECVKYIDEYEDFVMKRNIELSSEKKEE